MEENWKLAVPIICTLLWSE